MYLKCHRRIKDGKEHRYWSIAEKRRCADGRVVDRHLLYLGEINDSQQASWLRCIEAFEVPGQRQLRWGIQPVCVIFDLLTAFPKVVARVWPEAHQQFDHFHVMQWLWHYLRNALI